MRKKAKAKDIPGQPSKAEFMQYASSRGMDEKRAGDQWEMWDAGDWCDGDMTPIKNWKLKLVTFEKNGFGAFAERRKRWQQERRDRVTEASEEYKERKRLQREDEQQQRHQR